TIVQLWESPKEIGKRDFMKVNKALAIFDKVGTMKPYILDAVTKIEYGNATFHATQQFIQEIEVKEDNLIVKLTLDETRCKANDICGISTSKKELEEAEACCSPATGSC
ncbi:MAG: hypothetical protein KUG51_04145, partial [Urechidicola sp.]|nr:hypothetical protein [Urechidicola sp.]